MLFYFTYLVTFLVGKIATFPYKRAQRCAHSFGTLKTGKEAGEERKNY